MTDVEQTHTDIEACDRALGELVVAIIEYDGNEGAQARRRYLGEMIPFSGLADLDRMRFRSLTTDPVRSALRDGVKRLGREIHRLGGGTGAMLDSLDKVAEMHPEHAGRSSAILNAAWNGIGTGDDRWWS